MKLENPHQINFIRFQLIESFDKFLFDVKKISWWQFEIIWVVEFLFCSWIEDLSLLIWQLKGSKFTPFAPGNKAPNSHSLFTSLDRNHYFKVGGSTSPRIWIEYSIHLDIKVLKPTPAPSPPPTSYVADKWNITRLQKWLLLLCKKDLIGFRSPGQWLNLALQCVKKHSTEGAFLLPTQHPRVRILALPRFFLKINIFTA